MLSTALAVDHLVIALVVLLLALELGAGWDRTPA